MNKGNELDNIVFSTKSIMATEKQIEFIENLLDELDGFIEDKYYKIDLNNISKQQAKELISQLLDFRDYYIEYNYIEYGCY